MDKKNAQPEIPDDKRSGMAEPIYKIQDVNLEAVYLAAAKLIPEGGSMGPIRIYLHGEIHCEVEILDSDEDIVEILVVGRRG